MSLNDAKEYAYSRDLDLVLMSATATPPACRAMNYGKYRFERDKKEKEAKKRDNSYYADRVKSASGVSNKAYYRRCKIDHAAAHDRRIEQWKREIESAKSSLKHYK